MSAPNSQWGSGNSGGVLGGSWDVDAWPKDEHWEVLGANRNTT